MVQSVSTRAEGRAVPERAGWRTRLALCSFGLCAWLCGCSSPAPVPDVRESGASRREAAKPGLPDDPRRDFERVEAMVPMRDGVRLETVAYVPRESKERPPILLMRTPYGFATDPYGYSRWLTRPWLRDLLRDGYVLALQNVRGRFRSEGQYVIEPPLRERGQPGAVDDASDTFDTVEWLLSHVPNNGRVGMLGVSIPGRLVAVAMLEPHPAVRAYSPQATPVDNFLGDDGFHQGAFRLLPMFSFVPTVERAGPPRDFEFDRLDTYEWFLRMGPLSRANSEHFGGKLPSWNDFVAHPTHDDYWKRRSLPLRLDAVPAATLHVGGAFDQEDRRGPVDLYEHLEKRDVEGKNFLVVGPWAHRTWRLADGDALGSIDFGSRTAQFFRDEVQAPFFACHLKDRCGPPLPNALVFQTGSNVWQRFDDWPPRASADRSLYLHPGGRLAFEPPAETNGDEADLFVSDPASPVPFAARPIAAENLDKELRDRTWGTFLTADQRFVHGRPDVLAWETPPLSEEVVVSGRVTARLFVSTSGSDADFVAKLIDVYPESAEIAPRMRGYQFMVTGEILRGRFRRSFEKPEPFAPGKVEEVAIDLLTSNHQFKKGHRIMVQVQSSWFPLYDRNPQTFVPNIFEAGAADFQARSHRVHRSKRYPSRVTFESPP